MIKFTHKGDLSKTYSFLDRASKGDFYKTLNKYGQEGVQALASATPVDSGKTSDSWSYKIIRSKNQATIQWLNSNIVNGVSIAIILQYGHGTGTGGYVQGQDYINPTIKPIFDKIAQEVWKEVTRI